MGLPVIYSSSVTRRQARWRRVRRRSMRFGPRLAMLVMWGSLAAFAVAVIERLG
ncbi:MAG TPA: hypothetical protein VMT10_09455 [Solirubrobacteraceae bacterium]|nr:hypothetical protein [Solirubrobacteraceae bacterium]